MLKSNFHPALIDQFADLEMIFDNIGAFNFVFAVHLFDKQFAVGKNKQIRTIGKFAFMLDKELEEENEGRVFRLVVGGDAQEFSKQFLKIQNWVFYHHASAGFSGIATAGAIDVSMQKFQVSRFRFRNSRS